MRALASARRGSGWCRQSAGSGASDGDRNQGREWLQRPSAPAGMRRVRNCSRRLAVGVEIKRAVWLCLDMETALKESG